LINFAVASPKRCKSFSSFGVGSSLSVSQRHTRTAWTPLPPLPRGSPFCPKRSWAQAFNGTKLFLPFSSLFFLFLVLLPFTFLFNRLLPEHLALGLQPAALKPLHRTHLSPTSSIPIPFRGAQPRSAGLGASSKPGLPGSPGPPRGSKGPSNPSRG